MSVVHPKDRPTILFIGSNPFNTDPLRIAEEAKSIRQALERSGRPFTFINEGAVTDLDLREYLLRHTPTVVQLSGHGALAAETEGFIFTDERGRAKLLSSEALADLFELCQKGLQCVVCNGCATESVAQAISDHIPYVIGMSDNVGDNAARKFSAGFYEALAHGASYEQAFWHGRNAIDLAGIAASLVPVLKVKPGVPTMALFPTMASSGDGTLSPEIEKQLLLFLAHEFGSQKLARQLWEASGGRPVDVDIDCEDALVLWRSLWRRAKHGAIQPVALIAAALEKYPSSEILRTCMGHLCENGTDRSV